jgi:hypothetical protein
LEDNMRIRALPVVIVAALSVAAAGCLVESTLDAKGGGTLKLEMRAAPGSTLEKLKANFKGPGVEITKATLDEKQNFAIELTYADFRTLGALKQFENTTFTLTDDEKAKTRTATAVAKYAKPMTLPDDQLKYFGKDVTIAVTVPGKVVKSDGKTKGKTVKWTMPLNKLLGSKESTFSVTYTHDGAPLAALPAAAATPQAAAPKAAPATAAATPQPKK